MDGWAMKELGLMSIETYRMVAIMLNQIEAGARWPKSAVHARIVYLEKEGAVRGRVMSYRPITISAPIYRAWAALRLEDLHEWVEFWGLGEMYAGIPGRGATNAWREALMEVEEMHLENGA